MLKTSKKKMEKWTKIRGLLKFLIIMKRTINQKKLYGLCAEIKFLSSEDINEKKKLQMYNWIAGNLEK